jgi:hypothetical protein
MEFATRSALTLMLLASVAQAQPTSQPAGAPPAATPAAPAAPPVPPVVTTPATAGPTTPPVTPVPAPPPAPPAPSAPSGAQNQEVFPYNDYNEGLRKCTEYYFPVAENRVLKDMPISIMITQDQGDWKASPATGLDVYGLWVSITHPKCELKSHTGDLYFFSPGTGVNFYWILSADISLLTDTQKKMSTDNTMMPPSMTTTTDTAFAAFLNAATGLYADIRWMSRGHGNHIAVGFLGRGGYLLSGAGNRWYWTLSPVVSFSVF